MLFLVFVLTTVDRAHSEEFGRIVVFGANLADAGNSQAITPETVGFQAPPSPPYWMGRSMDGPNFVDLLADRLGIDRPLGSEFGGTNFAYGGATTGTVDNSIGVPNMDEQLADFLTADRPSANDLIVVSSLGLNNDSFFGESDPSVSTAAVKTIVSDLLSAGAVNVLVANTFLLESTDADLTEQYNDALASDVESLRLSNQDANIFELDMAEVFANIVADP